MIKNNTVRRPDEVKGACEFDPPDFSCCTPCPAVCDPCGESCPDKTRVRDSVAIGNEEISRCVSLYSGGCDGKKLPAYMHCIEMKVRKKGNCSIITVEIPYKATYAGAACFNWSKRFTRLANGYYEADIYVNGKTCYTWPFHIQDCYIRLETASVLNSDSICNDCGCSTGRSCNTPLEIESADVAASCEDCKEC